MTLNKANVCKHCWSITVNKQTIGYVSSKTLVNQQTNEIFSSEILPFSMIEEEWRCRSWWINYNLPIRKRRDCKTFICRFFDQVHLFNSNFALLLLFYQKKKKILQIFSFSFRIFIFHLETLQLQFDLV